MDNNEYLDNYEERTQKLLEELDAAGTDIDKIKEIGEKYKHPDGSYSLYVRWAIDTALDFKVINKKNKSKTQ